MNYRVGILGATGMVGQRLITLLADHPWFTVCALGASASSAGAAYEDAVKDRWKMSISIPPSIAKIVVKDAFADAAEITSAVDFVFCAIDLSADETQKLEEIYAKMECPVISNNSANRKTSDVPMIIPEINPQHSAVIPFQRTRLGTKRGFIAVKSNCSLQSYVPALHPLRKFGLERVLACTYQAVSGAGKTLESWPEMTDNVIPFIGGEEEKSQEEPMKIWGTLSDGKIVHTVSPVITAQCIRVPVADGHMAAVFAAFEKRPDLNEVISLWNNYKGEPQKLGLPSAPKQFLNYFTQENYPQTRLHRGLENGMAVSVGRLRYDNQYDIKFVSLSHNTLRGAAGGAVLMAELLCAQGWI